MTFFFLSTVGQIEKEGCWYPLNSTPCLILELTSFVEYQDTFWEKPCHVFADVSYL